MPLLTLKPQSKPHTIKIHFDANTLERLKRYCEFAQGDISSAVRESLIYIFDRDKEFRTWEQQLRHRLPDTSAKPPAASSSPASPGTSAQSIAAGETK